MPLHPTNNQRQNKQFEANNFNQSYKNYNRVQEQQPLFTKNPRFSQQPPYSQQHYSSPSGKQKAQQRHYSSNYMNMNMNNKNTNNDYNLGLVQQQ